LLLHSSRLVLVLLVLNGRRLNRHCRSWRSRLILYRCYWFGSLSNLLLSLNRFLDKNWCFNSFVVSEVSDYSWTGLSWGLILLSRWLLCNLLAHIVVTSHILLLMSSLLVVAILTVSLLLVLALLLLLVLLFLLR